MHFSYFGVHHFFKLIVLFSGSFKIVFQNTFAAFALVVLLLNFLILLIDQIFKVINLFFEITNVVTVLRIFFVSDQVGSVKFSFSVS